MRILHTSDWHIGRNLFEYSLYDDQKYFFDCLYKIIEQQQVDTVIVSGDIYNRSVPSADSVSFFNEIIFELINKLHVKVLIISGNHDSPQRISFANKLLENEGLYIEGEFNKNIKKVTLHDSFGKINFFMLPYFIPAQARMELDDKEIKTFNDAFIKVIEYNKNNINIDERNILMAHGFFANLALKDGENNIVTSESEVSVGGSDIIDINTAKSFDYVALGHIHAPQKVLGEYIKYSGSPLKYSISEQHQKKAVYIVDVKEKGNVCVKEIKLSHLNDVKSLQETFENLMENNSLHTSDYVFLHLDEADIIMNAISRLKTVYPNVLGLDYISSEYSIDTVNSVSYNIKNKPIEDLFSDFYKAVKDTEITPEQLEVVLEVKQELRGEEDASN